MNDPMTASDDGSARYAQAAVRYWEQREAEALRFLGDHYEHGKCWADSAACYEYASSRYRLWRLAHASRLANQFSGWEE